MTHRFSGGGSHAPGCGVQPCGGAGLTFFQQIPACVSGQSAFLPLATSSSRRNGSGDSSLTVPKAGSQGLGSWEDSLPCVPTATFLL